VGYIGVRFLLPAQQATVALLAVGALVALWWPSSSAAQAIAVQPCGPGTITPPAGSFVVDNDDDGNLGCAVNAGLRSTCG
jgi:hypothetical protein